MLRVKIEEERKENSCRVRGHGTRRVSVHFLINGFSRSLFMNRHLQALILALKELYSKNSSKEEEYWKGLSYGDDAKLLYYKIHNSQGDLW